jgi:FkbM family methyltransferase
MLNKIRRKILWEIYMFFQNRGYNISKKENFDFPDQVVFFKKQQPKVIFDLGANYGGMIGKYHKEFPQAAIYGFEPIESLYKQAIGHFKEISQVKLFCKAVTDYTGTIEFNINNSKDTSSIFESNLTNLTDSYKDVQTTVEKKEVPCIKIDDFCAENNIFQIDILKMDIQGGELKALQGAANMLKNGKISLIYTEVFFMKAYKEQPLFDDIAAYLHKHNYKMFSIYNVSFNGTTGRIFMADVIFVHENFAATNGIELSLKN